MIHHLQGQNNVNLLRRKWILLLGFCALLIAPFGMVRFAARREVAKQLSAIRAAGLPASPAELDAWYKPVAASSNRAFAILEAAKQHTAIPRPFEKTVKAFLAAEPGSIVPEEVLTPIQSILASNQPVIELLHKAAELPDSRYPIDLSQGPSTLLPHIAKVKSLVDLLRIDALFQFHQTNIPAAVQSLNTAFAVADSLRNEPLLISSHVRMQCVQDAITALARILGEHPLTRLQLGSLASSVAKAEAAGRQELFRGLAGERACNIAIFDMRLREIDRLGSLGSFGDDGFAQILGFQFYRVSGIHQRDLSCYLETMEDYIHCAKSDLPDLLQESRRAEQELDERLAQGMNHFAVLSRTLLVPLGKSVLKEANSAAILRSAQISLALEAFRLDHHGALPTTLADLAPKYIYQLPKDPYTGAALHFEPLRQGYRIFAGEAGGANKNHPSQKAVAPEFIVRR